MTANGRLSPVAPATLTVPRSRPIGDVIATVALPTPFSQMMRETDRVPVASRRLTVE